MDHHAGSPATSARSRVWFAPTLLGLAITAALTMGVDQCSPAATCLGTYELGEQFPASDGCNICTCGAEGMFICTEQTCEADAGADAGSSGGGSDAGLQEDAGLGAGADDAGSDDAGSDDAGFDDASSDGAAPDATG